MTYIRQKSFGTEGRPTPLAFPAHLPKRTRLLLGDISKDNKPPVHFDHRFTQAMNRQRKICHGLFVASILTKIGGQIGWLESEMNLRFKRPAYFGDTIECFVTITQFG